MGGYRWAQCTALILLWLLGLDASAATRKYVTMPSAKTVASGNGATSRNGDLLSKQGAALEGEYIPGESLNKSVPVPIIPRIDFSIPTTINAAKNLLKGGVQGMVLSAALQGMLDSVGAFIDENGQVVKSGSSSVDTTSGSGYYYFQQPYSSTHFSTARDACLNFAGTRTFYSLELAAGNTIGTAYVCTVLAPEGSKITAQVYRYGTACPSGSSYDKASGACVVESGSVSLTDTDWNSMGQFADGQSAEWLDGLVKDICTTDSCFEALKAGSSLSGPSSIPGGSTTTTGTYTRPDGTTGTETSTTSISYGFTYGDTYYDYSKRTSTTTSQDGKTTSESQTNENSDPTQEQRTDDSFIDPAMPGVPSFYKQQYPDGLKGVWESKKSELDDSAFLQFLRSFIPSFSGTCPSWGLSFDLGFISFGNHGFGSQCYALDFVGIVFLVTAAFAARALIFGG